jgi:Ku70/Ku80 N-terminal alpha/beta domain
MIQKSANLIDSTPSLSENPTALFEAFWLCNYIFQEIKNKKSSAQGAQVAMTSRRVFLFTTSDLPSCQDGTDQETANAQAEQHGIKLGENDIDLELFPIRTKGHLFDYGKFFSKIITIDPEEASDVLPGQSDRLADLAARVRRREFKKKRLGRVDFRIGEGVIIGTQLYALS